MKLLQEFINSEILRKTEMGRACSKYGGKNRFI
jgi:hypothetical protein